LFIIVYSNSIITRGNGEAIAISTGMNTEIGKIAEKVQGEDEPSPFQQDIDRFGKKLGIAIIIICFILFITEVVQIILFPSTIGNDFGREIINALNISISLAVLAVPERPLKKKTLNTLFLEKPKILFIEHNWKEFIERIHARNKWSINIFTPIPIKISPPINSTLFPKT